VLAKCLLIIKLKNIGLITFFSFVLFEILIVIVIVCSLIDLRCKLVNGVQLLLIQHIAKVGVQR